MLRPPAIPLNFATFARCMQNELEIIWDFSNYLRNIFSAILLSLHAWQLVRLLPSFPRYLLTARNDCVAFLLSCSKNNNSAFEYPVFSYAKNSLYCCDCQRKYPAFDSSLIFRKFVLSISDSREFQMKQLFCAKFSKCMCWLFFTCCLIWWWK